MLKDIWHAIVFKGFLSISSFQKHLTPLPPPTTPLTRLRCEAFLLKTCARGNVLWIWFCQSISLFIHPEPRITEMVHQVFLNFCVKWGSHKVRKVTKPVFFKKNQKDLQSPKNGPKVRFLCFWQISYLFICTFFTLLWNSLKKLHVQEKFGSWVMVQKPLNRSKHSLNHNILQTSWGIRLNFCMCWSKNYRSKTS